MPKVYQVLCVTCTCWCVEAVVQFFESAQYVFVVTVFARFPIN